VLCPARRKDILLGKNLAFAPLVLVLGAIELAIVQIVLPMRLDHFLALLPQLVSMYLLFCMLANVLAILAPMPIASGTLRPVNPKLVPIVLQMAFFFVFPMVLAPTLLPLGVEQIVEWLASVQGLPIFLGLSLLECIAVVCLYRLVLSWEGELLHIREQKILEIVTTKAE